MSQNQKLANNKLSITDLSLDDRPREKFAAQGAVGLSTSELLAILIGSGSNDENAVTLMQRIMTNCNNSLATLGRMTIGELCQYKGIGEAKAVTILAACELANRRMGERTETVRIKSAVDIYHYYQHRLQDLSHEESHVLLLNQHLRVINSKLISRGGITGTVVDVRMVLKEALLANATNIALCHNHPSGNTKASNDDDQLTENVNKAAGLMNIKLIDHVIVSYNGYYSYQEQGKL